MSDPARPPTSSTSPAGHAGVHGWQGEGIDPGEKVLGHWRAHHGHLVLTEKRLLLLSHPHVLWFKRTVEWTCPLEEIHNIEVIQCASTPSAQHIASSSVGSITQSNNPMSQSGGGSRGAIGIQDATLPGSFEVLVDDLVLYRGNPDHAQEIRDQIDAAQGRRLVELGKLPPSGSPQG